MIVRKLMLIFILNFCFGSLALLSQKSIEPYIDSVEWLLQNQLDTHLFIDYTDQIFKLVKGERDFSDHPKLLSLYDSIFLQYPVDSSYIRRRYAKLAYYVNRYDPNLLSAIQVYLKAHSFKLARRKHDNYAWYVENVLGTLYNQLGDHEESEKFYLIAEEALQKNTSNNCNDKYMRLCGNISYLYKWDNRLKDALAYGQKGYDLAQSCKNAFAQCSNGIFLIDLFSQEEKYRQAENILNEINPIIDNISNDPKIDTRKTAGLLTRFNNAKAELAKSKGDYQSAKQIYMATLADSSHLQTLRDRDLARTYTSLASIENIESNYKLASTYVQKGFKILCNSASLVPNLSYVTSDNTYQLLSHESIKIFEERFQKSGDTQFLDSITNAYEVAFESFKKAQEEFILEGSKLQSIEQIQLMLEGAIENQFKLANHPSRNLSEEEIRNIFDLSKSLLLQNAQQKQEIFNALPIADQKRARELKQKLSQLDEEILAKKIDKKTFLLSKTKTQKDLDEVIGLRKVQRQQISGDYIEYFIGKKNSYALSRRKTNLSVHDLGPSSELESSIKKIISQTIQKETSQEYYDQLKKLFAVLIKHDPAKNMTIIPSGVLLDFPFGMLINNEDQFLIEKTLINYAYSYQYYQDDESEAQMKWLCLSPTYKKPYGEIEETRSHSYYLPFANEEVKDVKTLLAQDAELSFDNNAENVLENLQNYSALHYAGHARFDAKEASLILNTDEDQKIRFSDLRKNYLNLETVVLSACETGLGKLAEGEGTYSLARGFKENGAKHVFYTLWKVDDQSMQTIIKKTYQRFIKSENFIGSLTQAKRKYLKENTNQHPYYWAAMIGSSQIQHRKTYNTRYYAIAFLSLLLLLFFFIKTKKP